MLSLALALLMLNSGHPVFEHNCSVLRDRKSYRFERNLRVDRTDKSPKNAAQEIAYKI